MSRPRRPHRRWSLAVLALAAVVATLSLVATWARQQLLDTDRWTQASSELLEQDEIRSQLAVFLTDQLFDDATVQEQIGERLPPELRPLAPAATAGARRLVLDVAERTLEQPAVQGIWEDANRISHASFVDVVEGRANAIVSREGAVVLQLREIVTTLASEIGLPPAAVARISPLVGDVRLVDADKVERIRDGAIFLQTLAVVLGVLTVLLLALAVWLVPGRRREALAGVGLALATSGVAGLLLRDVAGQVVVDAIVPSASIRPAAGEAWAVGTSLLWTLAVQAIVLGLSLVAAAWAAGPSRWATAARARMAPTVADRPEVALFGLAAVVLAVLVWAPLPALRQPLFLLMLAVLVPLAAVRLRRQMLDERQAASGAAA